MNPGPARPTWTHGSARAQRCGYYEAKVWMGTKQRQARPSPRPAQVPRGRASGSGSWRPSGRRARRQGRAVPTVREMLERHLTVILPPADGPRVPSQLPVHLPERHLPAVGRPADRPAAARAHRRRPRRDARRGPVALIGPQGARHPLVGVRGSGGARERRPEPAAGSSAAGAGESDQARLTQAEVRAVAAAAAGRPNAVRWSVGLACGLRQGEVLGLRWRYVDLDTRWLDVRFQLQRLLWQHGCGDAAPPGDIPLPRPACTEGGTGDHARSAARRSRKSGRRTSASRRTRRGCARPTARATRAPARSAAGAAWSSGRSRRSAASGSGCRASRCAAERAPRRPVPPAAHRRPRVGGDDLVFCQWNGRPDRPAPGLGRVVRDPQGGRAASLPAALDAALGGDHRAGEGHRSAVVQEMLGHSDIRVTRGYTHVSDALHEDAARRIGEMF